MKASRWLRYGSTANFSRGEASEVSHRPRHVITPTLYYAHKHVHEAIWASNPFRNNNSRPNQFSWRASNITNKIEIRISAVEAVTWADFSTRQHYATQHSALKLLTTAPNAIPSFSSLMRDLLALEYKKNALMFLFGLLGSFLGLRFFFTGSSSSLM
jgi:hypothetical protein